MKRIIIIMIVVLIVLSLVPLAFDWLIIGNSIPSNVSNSDWIGFLGSYFGGLFGGVFSLIGIACTIRFTQEQNKKDREIQARPFFDIIPKYEKKPVYTKKWLGYISVSIRRGDVNESYPTGSLLLNFKNIGNGSATNLSFDVTTDQIVDEHNAFFSNNNTKVTTNSLRTGEDADLSVDILTNYIMPDLGYQTVVDEDGNEHTFANIDIKAFPRNVGISVIIKYDDILGNHFQQRISLKASFCMNDKGRTFSCDIHVSHIEAPSLVSKKEMNHDQL